MATKQTQTKIVETGIQRMVEDLVKECTDGQWEAIVGAHMHDDGRVVVKADLNFMNNRMFTGAEYLNGTFQIRHTIQRVFETHDIEIEPAVAHDQTVLVHFEFDFAGN